MRLIRFRWSIVNQIGGKISIRSELGKGTDVEVTIPVEKSKNIQLGNRTFNDSTNAPPDAEECISKLRHRAAGKSVCFSRGRDTDRSNQKDISWSCIQRYCTEWFGLEIKETSADLIITDREDSTRYKNGQRVLIVHDDMACSTKQYNVHTRHVIGKICSPIGPFKLARSLLALLDQDLALPQKLQWCPDQAHAGTQTPLGSPEERTIMNGIISTDYGFTPPPFSTVPTPPTTEKPKPTTMALTAWHVQQQPASSQSFASIATLSLAQAPAVFPSPTFPAFPQPVMTLTLPNSKVLTPTPDPVPKPSSISKALHILAVDDNALNLKLLYRYLLKREGDIIVTAKNGVEAVEAVKSRRKGFDVIFMDISMPEMDGFEATRFVRAYENTRSLQLGEDEKVSMEKGKEEKRAYIVALTGLASRRDRDLAEECGFDNFLTKPISFKRIGELLRGLSEKGS